MLLQHDEVCRSYVEHVLSQEPTPDRQAMWLLSSPAACGRATSRTCSTAPPRRAAEPQQDGWWPRATWCG